MKDGKVVSICCRCWQVCSADCVTGFGSLIEVESMSNAAYWLRKNEGGGLGSRNSPEIQSNSSCGAALPSRGTRTERAGMPPAPGQGGYAGGAGPRQRLRRQLAGSTITAFTENEPLGRGGKRRAREGLQKRGKRGRGRLAEV